MPISESNFRFVQEFIRTSSAIVLEAGKDYLVESRLTPVARLAGFNTLDAFIEQIRNDATAVLLREQVVDALTTNETSFFRDLHPFDTLREQVLPAVIAQRAPFRKLTIWSAASSTGQEAYSIAMVLRESFPALRDWDVRIVGTDLSPTMVKRARQGTFSQLEVNRGLPIALLLKYFTNVQSRWVVNEDVKRLVEFQQLNLIKPWPVLPTFDIVFLRNVLIYFDVETKKGILKKIRETMQPSGYLFLGGSETTMNLDTDWDAEVLGKATVYRFSSPLAKAA